jgi:hypothetical protein
MTNFKFYIKKLKFITTPKQWYSSFSIAVHGWSTNSIRLSWKNETSNELSGLVWLKILGQKEEKMNTVRQILKYFTVVDNFCYGWSKNQSVLIWNIFLLFYSLKQTKLVFTEGGKETIIFDVIGCSWTNHHINLFLCD